MPSALTIAAAATVIVAVILAVARGDGLLAAFHPGNDGISFDLRLALCAVAITLALAGRIHIADWYGPMLLDAAGWIAVAYLWYSLGRQVRNRR